MINAALRVGSMSDLKALSLFVPYIFKDVDQYETQVVLELTI